MRSASLSDELTSRSAAELIGLMRSRQVSPVEVVAAHLGRVEEINPSINALVTIAPDAIDRARAAEQFIASGGEVGPLAGLPITIKDTIDTAGLRTTSGSRLRAVHVPERDAVVVARLKAAGAIILGKTNTPEMAIPYETDNPVFGRTNHPEDQTRTPGGSSGGEAAAIAAHLSPAGIGSDLSGSIRVPAHFCGIAGLKPTNGLAPMAGHVPEATGTLALGAAIGPMARRVADLILLLSVISDAPAPVSLDESASKLSGFRLAWYVADGISPVTEATARAVRTAAKMLEDAGLDIREELPPSISQGQRLWVELFSKPSRQQLHDRYRGQMAEAGPLVSQSLASPAANTLEDRINLAESLAKAVVEREAHREVLLRWMNETPLILAPVCATPAFEHGASRVQVERMSISVFRACSYAQTFNVFGFPAAVVPVLRSPEGLPIGVQVVATPGNDSLALTAASIIEHAAQFS
jgi:Asp-tRNA(Asn)/Glu-tRNA(Gln) amidotransferase A subunit family amidase